ncbi:uncharacterized protein LOC130721130 isoform X2 [Lotus japonicus]|uniref:uncharacterized protein LOC130721130 isoform X2 n=1 Tax=Lotus japonicus TaxID=34305 RepID=UPI0025842FC7|nr:uncharacterized protein LOC130721130 isoform X2 [Lotus japonicus]
MRFFEEHDKDGNGQLTLSGFSLLRCLNGKNMQGIPCESLNITKYDRRLSIGRAIHRLNFSQVITTRLRFGTPSFTSDCSLSWVTLITYVPSSPASYNIILEVRTRVTSYPVPMHGFQCGQHSRRG